MRRVIDGVDYNGLLLLLIEETLSNGSKRHSVVVQTQGEYRLDYPSDGVATAAFLSLKKILVQE